MSLFLIFFTSLLRIGTGTFCTSPPALRPCAEGNLSTIADWPYQSSCWRPCSSTHHLHSINFFLISYHMPTYANLQLECHLRFYTNQALSQNSIMPPASSWWADWLKDFRNSMSHSSPSICLASANQWSSFSVPKFSKFCNLLLFSCRSHCL